MADNQFPLDLNCFVLEDPRGGFVVQLILGGCPSHAGAMVVSEWVRSTLMGNLDLLGQMIGGEAKRDPKLGPPKSVS
jgi:hypothetical protein